MSERADVIVVGGGPAGSTVSSLVAMKGHKAVLLERERFPRYQIGESLLPATVHGVCRLLGVGDELEKAGFVRKRGGTFRWGAEPEPWTFDFATSPRFPGPTSFAYQVERAKFDSILLSNARKQGVDVREASPVTAVIEEDGRVVGVRYRDENERDQEIRAAIVVDASGHTSGLHKHMRGGRTFSPFFRNVALFGYFRGGKRLPAPNSGNILSVAFDLGWFWYIPLSDQLTSVGAVIHQDAIDHVKGDQLKAYTNLIARCPMIAEMLSDAVRIEEGTYGQIRVRKDYSYAHTHFWQPGMVLIGDAACFVDPVFSSGVHLATYSGLLAARSINSLLSGELSEERVFDVFERRYRREYSVFYEFLTSFYQTHREKDSYFWEAKQVTNSRADEELAFIDLVGGLASEDEILDAHGLAEQLSRSAEELEAAVGALARSERSTRRNPMLGAPVVNRAMEASIELQLEVALNGAVPHSALDGLIPSPDGLGWDAATA
jgi:FAD-dependent halogenase